jgi:hypothetical protein
VSPHKESGVPRNSGRERIAFLALGCVLVGAIAFVSFLPIEDKYLLHTRGRFHFWGHLLVFFVVAYVAVRISRSTYARVLFFLGSLAFGVGIEVGEHFAFGSVLEWKDVLVDSLGVVGGALIAVVSTPKERESKFQ